MKTRLLFLILFVVIGLLFLGIYSTTPIKSESLQAQRFYSGRFINHLVNNGGQLILNMDIGSNTVSGYMDFTNDPFVGALCGAGTFTGTRTGNTIQFSFISQDLDPGCGFDHGWVFNVTATISVDQNTISGVYDVTNGVPQSGSFSVTSTNYCDNVVEIPTQECDALVSLYNSTGGEGWTRRDGWLQTDRPCNWEGVLCEFGHVTEISLRINGLRGNLPPQLGNLPQLKILDLYWNSLKGHIPPQLGDLSNLEHLNLEWTELTTIPPELGNLSKLKTLYMEHSNITAIPPQLGNLSSLESLVLRSNNLSGSIPPELGQLSNLKELSLWDNNLTGTIPWQLRYLTNLELLDLDNNSLSGSIPPQLGELSNLLFLNLSDNKLSGGIPIEFHRLSNLRTLSVANNRLSGTIYPTSLDRLLNLEYLDISGNYGLQGKLPMLLWRLNKLQGFYYNNTNLCEPTTPEFQGWLAGISSLGRTGPCNSNLKPLIILVHGCCGGRGSAFGNYPSWLANSGYPVYVIDSPNFGYINFWQPGANSGDTHKISEVSLLPPADSYEDLGIKLSQLIADATQRASGLYNGRIILVAHSKGGLVSRAFLESSEFELQKKAVSKVIMLGTPNLGSRLAELYFLGPTVAPGIVFYAQLLKFLNGTWHPKEMWNLTPHSVETFNDHHRTRADGVDYHLIAGNSPSFFTKIVHLGPNDGTVAVSSVHTIPGNNENNYIYVREGIGHSEYNDGGVFSGCVFQIIGDEDISSCDNYTLSLNSTEQEWRMVGSYSNQIAANQTISHNIQIDNSEPSMFYLFDPKGDLGFSLIDPQGTRITPSTSVTDSNILFEAEVISDVVASRYLITNTVSGLWALEISGSSSITEDITFSTITLHQSEFDMVIDTDQSNYLPNQETVITATFTSNVIGAHITATVINPNRITETLLLYDDGIHNDSSSNDGIYGNKYIQTNTSGYYGLSIQSSGVYSNTGFQRVSQTMFAVNSTGASFNGQYNDFGEDDDGDGWYERLIITTGVDANTAGDYSVSLLLKDKAGDVIANQVVYTELITGTNVISVPFSREVIFNHSVEGPYTVDTLSLLDVNDVLLKADEVFSIYTTSAYEYTDFEVNPFQETNTFLPVILKQ